MNLTAAIERVHRCEFCERLYVCDACSAWVSGDRSKTRQRTIAERCEGEYRCPACQRAARRREREPS